MSQAREAGGYRNAEAGGTLIHRVVSLTIDSTVGWTSGEQLFTVVGLLLATDTLVSVSPDSVAVAAGLAVLPGRVSADSQIGVLVATVDSVSVAAQSALNYNVIIHRR